MEKLVSVKYVRNSLSTFVCFFTILIKMRESPLSLNSEETEKMYSKHLSV